MALNNNGVRFMPMSPDKFISALTKTIEYVAYHMQVKIDESGKANPLVASKLYALALTLKNLPQKLNAKYNDVTAEIYQKEIHRVMANAYIDAYRIGRKQVAGKLKTATTAKDKLTQSLEHIIRNALATEIVSGAATTADNYLLPADFNPKEKFEKQFLRNISDADVVETTFIETLTAIRLALEEGARSRQLEVATNGMKVAVRFSPEGMTKWNELVANVGLSAELGITFDKNGQPKEAGENKIKKILDAMVPKKITASGLDNESLLKITTVITFLEKRAADIRINAKPLTSSGTSTPTIREDVENIFDESIKISESPPLSPRPSLATHSSIPDIPVSQLLVKRGHFKGPKKEKSEEELKLDKRKNHLSLEDESDNDEDWKDDVKPPRV